MTQFRTPAPDSGLTIGRLGSAPVVLSYSWFALAAVVVAVMGPRLAEQSTAEGSPALIGYLLAFGYVLVLFCSVLLHESAHAVIGNRAGHRSERVVLTFLGGHTSLAGPVQGSPANRDLLRIALAGPAANLAAAGLGWLALSALPESHPETTVSFLLGELLFAFIWSNVLLGGFNLLPGLPLDGGQMVESAVWSATGRRRKGTEAAAWSGVVIGCGVVALAVVLGLLGRAMPMVLGTGATGAFIAHAAYSQLQRIPLLTFIESWDVFARMRPVIGTIDATMPVPAWPHGVLAVSHEGRVVGYVDAVQPGLGQSSPGHLGPGQTAAHGGSAADSMLVVSGEIPRDASAAAVIQALSQPGVWAVAVMDEGRCVGVLTQEDLAINDEDLAGRPASSTPEKDA